MKKLLTLFLSFFIFSCIVLVNFNDTVKANTDFYENFDNPACPTGQIPLSYNDFMETYSIGNYYGPTAGIAIGTTLIYSGTKSLCWQTPNGGNKFLYASQINITDGADISYLEFKRTVYYDGQAGGLHSTYMYFNTSTDYLFGLRLDGILVNPLHRVRIYNAYTSTLYCDFNISTTHPFITFNITFSGSSADIDLYTSYTGDNDTSFTVSYVNSGTFAHIYLIEASNPTSIYFFNAFDDFIVSYISTSTGQYGNLEAYTSIGSINRYNYMDVDYQCIEKKYDIAITTTIKGVDLQVGTTQYNDDHNLNNYQLYVNGAYCGAPDYFFPNDISGYNLRWVFDLPINNVKPIFEFYHNALVVTQNFWYLYDGYPNSMLDLDVPYPDNLIQYKYGNIFPDGIYSNNYFINYDLAMKFYYVNLVIPEGEIGFNDSIVLIDDNGYYPSNETYRFSCYASTLIPQTYFYAYLENVSLNVQDYPYLMSNSHEYFQFTPSELGNYSFTIRRNNVNVTYFNMTVTQGEQGYLYTYPNPSKANELYTIAYAYYDEDGDNGLISISLTPTSIINTTPIFANSSGTFTSVGTNTVYYISLYTLIGNEYALSKQHIHFVDIATYGLPELDISKDTLIVGETQVFSVTQELFEHTTLKLNGVIIASNIHGENVFQLSYVMEYGGLYNASLHDMYSDILLDYELFTVTGESYEPPVFGIEADTFKIIEGLVIVILLMFIPFGLSIMGANVGTTIYLLFLFIGCVIATLLGLFPYFIPASIIVCEILGIIVLKFWR